MRRREFITLVGGAAATWPMIARAQQPAMPVIGYLSTGNFEQFKTSSYVAAIRDGLSEMGYVEGRNYRIEFRGAENRFDRMPGLAADLIQRGVAVIIAPSTPSALAAKRATNSIAIVFQTATDPVTAGLVASLNRPGGNVTGVSNLFVNVAAKRLELLHEMVPSALSVALLTNLTNPAFAEPEASELQIAAHALDVSMMIVSASDPSEFEGAFATFAKERAGAILVSGESVFFGRPDLLVSLAARYKMPAMYPSREHTAAGGLMSYGTAFSEVFRQVGVYAGRILKGEKPADLPVQLVTKMQLAINMKTAKALGITFPLSLLGRADEVIE
jgi:ABC-type uncharacterized transport system substrate-binding protein